MTKFMVLYSSTLTASELMSSATPEQMQAAMAELLQWKEEADKTAKIEFGLPLQAVSRISPEGLSQSDSQVSGYSIIETESKEAANELLKNHPHLKRPGAYLDVFELLSMPGLEI